MTIPNELMPFIYNKETITYTSLDAFNLSSRQLNDKNNKTRENIIGSIINNKVPNNYYLLNEWLYMKQIVCNYLEQLTEKPYVKVDCNHKAGRKNNYDFSVMFYYLDEPPQVFNVELKFNASSIDDAPQFVSPMNPSQYMNDSYEEYYYNNYLPQLAEFTHFTMPTKTEYIKQIHSNKPNCMKPYQELYYKGCSVSRKFTNKKEDIEFYMLAKQTSNESITSFVKNTELQIEKLSQYLHKTQTNKIYMLYSNKSFILQKVNIDDYSIDKVNKNADKHRYECISTTGKRINVLLRWKNGNGIAFPAFQIS